MNRVRAVAAGTALVLVLALVLASQVFADDGWSFPEEFRDKLSGLDNRQRAFVTGGAILDYMPERQLHHELETRKADALARMIADVMAVAEQMGYDPERDMGAMPLNATSDRFNADFVRTPEALRELEREPGPFSVHRYLFPASGVPTFAGARVAIWPEDLVAGKVDVAIVGIPNDMGSGRRNAEHGPRAMRALNTMAVPDVQSLVDPMKVLSIVDYGDFAIDNMSVERTIDHVTEMVAETAATGAVPMLVGGDTSMLYPGVKGVAQSLEPEQFGLVHFSAHPDAVRTAVHTISDTQAIFRLLDEGIVRGEDLVQIGLRGSAVDVDTLTWLREQGVRYHTMAEIDRRGFPAVLARVLDAVDRGPARIFVSIDVSVIEPSEMIAAGRLAANGLGVKQVASAIRHLCAAREIVGFEITDVAPMLDNTRASVMNANTMLNACLAGMAVRAAGHSPEFIHPLSIDHGKD